MEKKILFNATRTIKRAALLENDKIVELVVERPDQYLDAKRRVSQR